MTKATEKQKEPRFCGECLAGPRAEAHQTGRRDSTAHVATAAPSARRTITSKSLSLWRDHWAYGLQKFRFMWRMLFILAALGCTVPADEDVERRKPRVDASTTTDDPPPPPGDPAAAGVVSCYSSGAPNNTCTSPAYCCFNNYTADRNGYCTTTGTDWGVITCDGPEDCSAGQRCCATAIRNEGSLIANGYRMACQSSCGGPTLDYELCHPNASTCAQGSCVTAYGNATDLPRSLYVCK